MRGLCVLGATGSVGLNTLEVASANPGAFRVVALTANRDADAMAKLVRRFQPRHVVMVDTEAARRLRELLPAANCEIHDGAGALCEVAALDEVETVMAAIVGAAGLPATFAAAEAGKRILLATKEALVSAGHLLMDCVQGSGAEILPVDSEHNAIFQCLPTDYVCGIAPEGVRRMVLTASGGPFRDWTWEQMQSATPEQAVAHPNWDMGRKISVDSATMMNKGLELIEAAYLFGMSESDVDVVVHRQSIVHSLVEFTDGSLLAQLGSADMKIPIAHAMLHPQRGVSTAERLDLVKVGRLDFVAPDIQRFPALRLAREALQAKNAMTAVFNAANEIAVDAFLSKRIAFTDIPVMAEQTMEKAMDWDLHPGDLDAAIAIDQEARAVASEWEAVHG